MAAQGVHLHGVGPRELVRLVEVLAAALEGLLAVHRAPIALHGRRVGRDHLRREHALNLILRLDAGESGGGRVEKLDLGFLVGGMGRPEAADHLLVRGE